MFSTTKIKNNGVSPLQQSARCGSASPAELELRGSWPGRSHTQTSLEVHSDGKIDGSLNPIIITLIIIIIIIIISIAIIIINNTTTTLQLKVDSSLHSLVPNPSEARQSFTCSSCIVKVLCKTTSSPWKGQTHTDTRTHTSTNFSVLMEFNVSIKDKCISSEGQRSALMSVFFF